MGTGWGVPLRSPLQRILGRVVSSPPQAGSGAEHGRKRVLVYFELEYNPRGDNEFYFGQFQGTEKLATSIAPPIKLSQEYMVRCPRRLAYESAVKTNLCKQHSPCTAAASLPDLRIIKKLSFDERLLQMHFKTRNEKRNKNQGNRRHHTSPPVLPPGESLRAYALATSHVTHCGQTWRHPQKPELVC